MFQHSSSWALLTFASSVQQGRPCLKFFARMMIQLGNLWRLVVVDLCLYSDGAGSFTERLAIIRQQREEAAKKREEEKAGE